MPAGVQGTKRGRLLHQPAHVVGVEAVHVLRGIHEVEHALGIDLRRQGKLDQDAVDVGAALNARTSATHLRRVACADRRRVS